MGKEKERGNKRQREGKKEKRKYRGRQRERKGKNYK